MCQWMGEGGRRYCPGLRTAGLEVLVYVREPVVFSGHDLLNKYTLITSYCKIQPQPHHLKLLSICFYSWVVILINST